MKRLAILSTHPIQYNAPLFRLLAQEKSIDLKVFYSKKAEQVRFDKEFGQEIAWDVLLTDGYEHQSFNAKSKAGCNAMLESIEAFKPHVVLVYGWNFDGHMAAMEHFHGAVPVWFRGDSTLLDPMPLWKRALRKVYLNWVYRSVDRAFYVGTANKRYFLWCGLKEEQLTLAPHAVDNEFFMKDDESRREEAQRIRIELGIPLESIVFLFAGKLEPRKQPLELAKAFCEITNEGESEVHLVYVGSGMLEEELKSRFDANPKIHFVGFQNQSQMPIWYRVGDILCLPSIIESWGLAVNEALACGGRVIVSDRVGCAEDLVSTGETGYIIPALHPELWHKTMLHMTRDSTGMNAKKNFLIDWNLEAISKAITRELL